jgi:hypothetical protein
MNDLVLITSVINTGKLAWSYTETRSTYSAEQRYNQSLQTIDSIRKYLPGAKILYVECSDISNDYITSLSSKVEYFVNQYDIAEARAACLETNKKGFGEAIQTKLAIEYIIQNNLTFNRFFKISGRYFLTDKFVSDKYRTDVYTFKRRADTGNHVIAISTVVYSFPMSFLHNFYSCVSAVVDYYKINGPRGYEELLPIICEPRNEIEIIGAAGLVAVNDEYFTC